LPIFGHFATTVLCAIFDDPITGIKALGLPLGVRWS